MPAKINPTRMELAKLKKRLNSALRGYKLLKDKQDELVRQFMLRIKENAKLRRDIDNNLNALLKKSRVASILMGKKQILEALMLPIESIQLSANTSNVMGVTVPKLARNSKTKSDKNLKMPYSFLSSSVFLDQSISDLSRIFDDIICLAVLEKTCSLLAIEIEKSRRRVNALEHMMIPQLKKNIKYINAKLEDSERSNITRMMKVKELVLN